MRKVFTYLALVAAVALSLSSCSKKGKVIPRGTMSEIYAEIFIADQWLRSETIIARSADTLLFYEPIFNSYGYTTADFVSSAGYYLHDPKRFTRILKKSSSILDARHRELEALFDNIESLEVEILEYRASTPHVPAFYDSLFFEQALDRIVDIQPNEYNVYMPVYEVPVPEDSLTVCDTVPALDSTSVDGIVPASDSVLSATPKAPALLDRRPAARPEGRKTEQAKMGLKEVLPVQQ